MIQITELTDQFKQLISYSLEDGKEFDLALSYNPMFQTWTYSITTEDKSINNRKLVVSPNVLGQFEYLGFGLAVTSSDSQDPFLLNDFISGRISIFILNSEEVIDIRDNVILA